jgi:long-chain acyl-CoA synthetase
MLSTLLESAPDGAPALVRSSGASTSYGQLRQAVAHAAEGLRAHGVGPGKTVAVSCEDPEAFLLAALACWRLEGAVVPLDARLGPDRLSTLAHRAKASAWVKGATPEGELTLESEGHRGGVDPRAGLVLFTSGSSGPPKGVVLPRAGIAANVDAILSYLPVARHPRTALVLPLWYSYALVGQALTTLRAGGTLLLLGDLGYPALQVEAMATLRADGLSSVPTSLRLLALVARELPAAQRPPLAYLASAGAALPPALPPLLREAFPQARLFNQYGLTEASPRVTALESTDEAFGQGSVGKPLPGIQVRQGPDGELQVKGPSVMLGYLEGEGPPPFTPDGWLKTGDFARVTSDGYVFVEGRLDGVVKCGGERVSTHEVAQALQAAVRGAPPELCVVAVPDETWGARLFAFVEGTEAQAAELREAAKTALPAFKRPAKVVALERLPRTANGKPELPALRALVERR